jgi:hypothetical protein
MNAKKDDLRVASRISQLMSDIDSAHLSHGNIEDDNIGSEPEVLADDSSPVGYGGDDPVAFFFFEHLADMVENDRIIIA